MVNQTSTGKMGSASGVSVQQQPQQTQGLTALLVMIAVLVIILAYCFWGAPWCRNFCRRRVCCLCPMDEPELPEGHSRALEPIPPTPTIILLPFGRMLVVDSSMFAQFQTDSQGLDLMELGDSYMRSRRYQVGSTPSIYDIDSETTSKGISPISERFMPPTYESLFGSKDDKPPSYSEISEHLREFFQRKTVYEHHLQQLEGGEVAEARIDIPSEAEGDAEEEVCRLVRAETTIVVEAPDDPGEDDDDADVEIVVESRV